MGQTDNKQGIQVIYGVLMISSKKKKEVRDRICMGVITMLITWSEMALLSGKKVE